MGIDLKNVMSVIDAELENAASSVHGPFLDPDTLVAYHRANILHGIDAIGRDLLDRLASTDAANAFAQYLGKGKGETGEQYLTYYMDRIGAAGRTLSMTTLVKDLAALDLFGPRALYPLYEEGAGRTGNVKGTLKAARAFTARSDSRPSHRYFAIWIARFGLADAPRSERLMRSVVEDAPQGHGDVLVWLAQVEGDVDGLRATLARDDLSPDVRSKAVENLATADGADPAVVKAEYEKIIATSTGEWKPVERYVEWLEKRGEHEAVLQVTRKWLERKDRKKDLTEDRALTAAARALLALGKPDEAWNVISPMLPRGFQGAYIDATRILLAQGEVEKARDMAEMCLERYPDPDSMVLSARVEWDAGRPNDAATLLATKARKMTVPEWRSKVGGEMAEAFGGADTKQGIEAFQALQDARIGLEPLLYAAIGVHHAGEPQLAFEMKSRIRAKGMKANFIMASAYASLKAAKGEDAALAWLKERIHEDERDPMCQMGYEVGSDELAWTMVKEPAPKNEHLTWIWLMREAAYLRMGTKNAEWRERLDEHYAAPPEEFYDHVALFLQGREDEPAVWASVEEYGNMVEAAYFYGLKAKTGGQDDRASSWWRACLENGSENASVVSWCYEALWGLQ